MSSRQLRVRVRRGRSRNTSDHGEHFGSHSKHRAVVVKGELGERPVLRVYCGPKVKAANVPKACQQLLTYVMSRCREDKIVPRESVVRCRLQETDEQHPSGRENCAVAWTSLDITFERWLHVLLQSKACVVEAEAPQRVLWPTDAKGQPERFEYADYFFPVLRFESSQIRELFSFLRLQRSLAQVTERGRFGMAAFLHEEGPEFLKEAPIGFVIELVQLLTNRTVLRFRKGRFIFQKEVANKYEDALPAEEDADKHNAAGVLEDSSGGSDEEGVSDKLPSIPLGDNMALLEAKCRQSSLSLVLGVHFEVTGDKHAPRWTCLCAISEESRSSAQVNVHSFRSKEFKQKLDAADNVAQIALERCAVLLPKRGATKPTSEKESDTVWEADRLMAQRGQQPLVYRLTKVKASGDAIWQCETSVAFRFAHDGSKNVHTTAATTVKRQLEASDARKHTSKTAVATAVIRAFQSASAKVSKVASAVAQQRTPPTASVGAAWSEVVEPNTNAKRPSLDRYRPPHRRTEARPAAVAEEVDIGEDEKGGGEEENDGDDEDSSDCGSGVSELSTSSLSPLRLSSTDGGTSDACTSPSSSSTSPADSSTPSPVPHTPPESGDERDDASSLPAVEESTCTRGATRVGSSRVDLQACKLEYSIVSPK